MTMSLIFNFYYNKIKNIEDFIFDKVFCNKCLSLKYFTTSTSCTQILTIIIFYFLGSNSEF